MSSLRTSLDDQLAKLEQHLAVRLANPSPGDRFWFELQAKDICSGTLVGPDHAHAVSRLGAMRLQFVDIAFERHADVLRETVDFVRSDTIAVR